MIFSRFAICRASRRWPPTSTRFRNIAPEERGRQASEGYLGVCSAIRHRRRPEQTDTDGLEEHMKLRVNPRIGSLALACALVASFTWVNAQQRGGTTVAI